MAAHLPTCRYDFLSVLDCTRARCYPARAEFMEIIWAMITLRNGGKRLGSRYGVYGADLEDAVMTSLEEIVTKKIHEPAWSAEAQNERWTTHPNADIVGITPLLNRLITNELLDQLNKVVVHRRRIQLIDATDLDPNLPARRANDALENPFAPRQGVDPYQGYTRPVEPYVVDALQNEVVSPEGLAAVTAMLERLSTFIQAQPDDEQRMMWSFLRDWGNGGSARSAIASVFGTTSGGNPKNHIRNNAILNQLQAFVDDEVERIPRNGPGRDLLTNFAHAVHAAGRSRALTSAPQPQTT